MTKVVNTPYPAQGLTDQELVREWCNEYANYVDAATASGDRTRLLRNFAYYDGINHGQWDPEVVRQLKNEGKPAHTYNWIQNLLDVTMGHLQQAPVGIQLVPSGAGNLEARDVFQSMYEMDYSRGKYQFNFDKFFLDGLIGMGVLQAVWDTDDDRLGNMSFRARNPKHVVRDPYWNSSDIRDCRAVFDYSWETADQIKGTWPGKASEIDESLRAHLEFDTEQNDTPTADRTQPYYDEDGSQFKVINAYWQETVKVRRVIDISRNLDVEYDMKGLEKHPFDVVATIVKAENPNWELIHDTDSITRVTTFCPAISTTLVLENTDYPLQLGQLPFTFFWYKDDYENKQGLVDKLIDGQDVFNKRLSMVSHALGGGSGAGNWFVEKGVFGGDENRLADFQERVSSNGQVFEVNSESLGKDPKVQEIKRPQMPLDILKSTDDQKNYLQDLAMVTPGMQGYSEHADESGKLYQSKVRQGEIGLEILAGNIKHKMDEIGRMYIKGAKQVYSGPSRKFVDKETNKEFEINRWMVGPDGNPMQMNFVSELPDYLIRVEEKRIGKSKQNEQIQTFSEMLQFVADPLLKARIEGSIAQLMDFGDQSSSEMTEASELWYQNQKLQLEAQNAQAQALIKQASQPPPQQGQAPQAPQQAPQ